MNADFRLALRQLRKSPGFAVAAVLTLALAIGANAVVFSVLNALVLRPLKVPNPESLYMLERAFERGSTPSQAYPDYIDLRDRNHSFESLVSYDIVGPVGLDTGGGNPSVVWPYLITGNYFDSLGIQPYLGRFLHSSDEHGKNSVPYVVLSYAYWHSHFNHDPAAVGRAVQINKHPYTILAVAPADFRGTELFFAPDLWAPAGGPAAVRRMGSDRESRLPFHLGHRPFETRSDARGRGGGPEHHRRFIGEVISQRR